MKMRLLFLLLIFFATDGTGEEIMVSSVSSPNIVDIEVPELIKPEEGFALQAIISDPIEEGGGDVEDSNGGIEEKDEGKIHFTALVTGGEVKSSTVGVGPGTVNHTLPLCFDPNPKDFSSLRLVKVTTISDLINDKGIKFSLVKFHCSSFIATTVSTNTEDSGSNIGVIVTLVILFLVIGIVTFIVLWVYFKNEKDFHKTKQDLKCWTYEKEGEIDVEIGELIGEQTEDQLNIPNEDIVITPLLKDQTVITLNDATAISPLLKNETENQVKTSNAATNPVVSINEDIKLGIKKQDQEINSPDKNIIGVDQSSVPDHEKQKQIVPDSNITNVNISYNYYVSPSAVDKKENHANNIVDKKEELTKDKQPNKLEIMQLTNSDQAKSQDKLKGKGSTPPRITYKQVSPSTRRNQKQKYSKCKEVDVGEISSRNTILATDAETKQEDHGKSEEDKCLEVTKDIHNQKEGETIYENQNNTELSNDRSKAETNNTCQEDMENKNINNTQFGNQDQFAEKVIESSSSKDSSANTTDGEIVPQTIISQPNMANSPSTSKTQDTNQERLPSDDEDMEDVRDKISDEPMHTDENDQKDIEIQEFNHLDKLMHTDENDQKDIENPESNPLDKSEVEEMLKNKGRGPETDDLRKRMTQETEKHRDNKREEQFSKNRNIDM